MTARLNRPRCKSCDHAAPAPRGTIPGCTLGFAPMEGREHCLHWRGDASKLTVGIRIIPTQLGEPSAVPAPPCDDCDKTGLCATQSLACQAYHRYSTVTSRRKARALAAPTEQQPLRIPLREWWIACEEGGGSSGATSLFHAALFAQNLWIDDRELHMRAVPDCAGEGLITSRSFAAKSRKRERDRVHRKKQRQQRREAASDRL